MNLLDKKELSIEEVANIKLDEETLSNLIGQESYDSIQRICEGLVDKEREKIKGYKEQELIKQKASEILKETIEKDTINTLKNREISIQKIKRSLLEGIDTTKMELKETESRAFDISQRFRKLKEDRLIEEINTTTTKIATVIDNISYIIDYTMYDTNYEIHQILTLKEIETIINVVDDINNITILVIMIDLRDQLYQQAKENLEKQYKDKRIIIESQHKDHIIDTWKEV